MLYFAGILAVAKTFENNRDEKIKILQELLDLSPIERIQAICNGKEEKALDIYNEFLKQISDESVRAKLEKVQRSNRKKFSCKSKI